MKPWKILQIVGVLILLVGVVMMVGKSDSGPMWIIVGVLLYAVGRVMTWLKSDRA